jgi:hypothetical protein
MGTEARRAGSDYVQRAPESSELTCLVVRTAAGTRSAARSRQHPLRRTLTGVELPI